jgi:hypothetical protein
MTALIVSVALCGLALAACTFFVVLACHAAPLVEDMSDEEEELVRRVMQIIASAKHHREQLEARANEIVEIHNREPGSCDADDLRSVVYDGEDYALTMTRIFRRARAMR